MAILFKPFKITKSQLSSTAISEGRFIICTDTGEMYLDKDNTHRIQLSGAKENTSNKVTSISSSSTNTEYPSAKAVYDERPTSQTITLTAANWVLNSTTNLYEYTVTDASITALHKVEGIMDLENQAKIKDGYTETFAGSYKFYTSELPTENITMTVIIQLVKEASV